MTSRTHAFQCEHGSHPKYCAPCKEALRLLHGGAPRRPRWTPRPGEGPMPPWFREAAARSIAEAQAAAHRPEQPQLDLNEGDD